MMNFLKKPINILCLFLIIWFLCYSYLSSFSNFIVDTILNLESGRHFTEAFRFFIFEVPKVFLLLILIILVVGIIRTYFSAEKTKEILKGKPLFIGNIMAAFLGIVTPFCSCSAIPLFLGFIEAGIPIGITFSFLIAAPMINEVAIVLLIGLFGWEVTLIYIFTGLAIAITSGWLIGVFKLEKYVEDWVFQVKSGSILDDNQKISFNERIAQGITAVKDIVGKIWIYIVLGIAVGSGAHGYVPEDFLSNLMGKAHWYSVPLAILIGVPLYSNAAGIIPIVSVLIEKGVTIGTALAFMMSVIGLSLPEVIILKKVLKIQLIAIFVVIVAIGIIIIGYLLNFIY
ncbi:MAG: permease [Bacteroidales bacterium]|nr:permease [Bacteroidales bacterium]